MKPVILTPAEAQLFLDILSSFANMQTTQANRTRNAAIEAHCRQVADSARKLAEDIVRRMYEK